MANVIKISVENASELLNAGMYDTGAIIRVQSAATQAGAYSNETTADLVSGTAIYTVFDSDGTSTTWYRTRYENAGGTSYSDWSDPFQVGGEEAGYVCSIYDVKQRLGLAASDTSADEDLLEFIRAVTVDIEMVTGRDFTGDRSDTTFLVDTDYGTILWLPRGIQSVTTLKVATTSQPDTGGTYETLAAADFVLRPSAGSRDPGWPATSIRRIDGGMFWDATNGAEITGKRGFAAVPANIARVGTNAVVRAYRARASGGADYAIMGPDGGTRMLRYLSPEDRDVLTLYADMVVA